MLGIKWLSSTGIVEKSIIYVEPEVGNNRYHVLLPSKLGHYSFVSLNFKQFLWTFVLDYIIEIALPVISMIY